MSDSERSEAFGTPRESSMSSDDAAELEELRREAAVLREQLENAVGSHGGAATAPATCISSKPGSTRLRPAIPS